MRSGMMTALAVLWLGSAAAASAAPASYHVIDRIPGPDGGWDYVRVDAVNNRVLVTRGDSVMAVDLASRQVTTGLAPGSHEHVALPINAGTELLVTNGGTDRAVFVDALTQVQIASTPTGKGPDDAVFDTRSGLLLVIDHAGGDVTLIDAKTHLKAGVITVGGELEEAAVDGKGRAFVNIENRNEIAVLDIAARTVTGRYALAGCDGPTGLAYDAVDRLLIAACDGATDLVDARTGKVAQTLATGKGADGVAYDARRGLAFVPAGRDGTLTVIALEHGRGRILDVAPTARSARTIGIDDRTGRLYLPSADYVFPAGGDRPTTVPGSFRLLVVGR